MRVAIIHTKLVQRGGTESYLIDLIRTFTQQGDQVDLYVTKADKDHPLLEQINLKTISTALMPRPFLHFYFAKKIAYAVANRSYDLIISLTRTFGQHIAICGGTHLGHLAKKIKHQVSLKDKMQIYLDRECFQNTPKIVAHSRLIQKELRRYYSVPTDKTHLLYPPINVDQFTQELHAKKTALREKYGISKNKKVLLFPSTGHHRKGLYLLLQAMQQLPVNQFELIVAGSQLNQNMLPANVRSVGFVNNMAELYAAVDFMILPSYYEPFGLVVIEALQCGVPVIVSGYVGAKDFITAKEGIVLSDLSVQTIVQSILEAVEQNFIIEPNFAQSRGLCMINHVHALKNLVTHS